jgi:hypothetical protein
MIGEYRPSVFLIKGTFRAVRITLLIKLVELASWPAVSTVPLVQCLVRQYKKHGREIMVQDAVANTNAVLDPFHPQTIFYKISCFPYIYRSPINITPATTPVPVEKGSRDKLPPPGWPAPCYRLKRRHPIMNTQDEMLPAAKTSDEDNKSLR